MSSIYISEPPTNGKVNLKTSVGDIEIELWSKECPKAARNFVQLCMDGYYNGTIFHRVVPGFIVQGGDPTGSGMGGESCYGEPFKDEFHSRLKFARRGLVAMANAGPNDNGSQFFFTFDKTPDLQGKHTIFGTVVGNTLYNMLKLGEVDVDKNERPLHPHKIHMTEVMNNPFPDVVPRKAKSEKDEEADERKAKASAIKAEKNFTLLSFGDEAEEEEEVNSQFTGNGKSAHDFLNDEKLSAEPAVRKEELYKAMDKDEKDADELREKLEEKERIKRRMAEKLRTFGESSGDQKSKKKQQNRQEDVEEEDDLDNMLFSDEMKADKARLEAMKIEYKQLQKQLVKFTKKPTTDEADKPHGSTSKKEPEKNELQTSMAVEQEKYRNIQKATPARKTADREQATLALLQRFKSKMYDARERHPSDEGGSASSAEATGGAPSKLISYFEDEEEDEDLVQTDDWMAHKFVVPEAKDQLHVAKDANVKTEESYDLHDPRNPMNKRRREMDRNSKSSSHRSGGGDRGSHGRRDRDDDYGRDSKRSRRD